MDGNGQVNKGQRVDEVNEEADGWPVRMAQIIVINCNSRYIELFKSTAAEFNRVSAAQEYGHGGSRGYGGGGAMRHGRGGGRPSPYGGGPPRGGKFI